jgi:hypothetical protein
MRKACAGTDGLLGRALEQTAFTRQQAPDSEALAKLEALLNETLAIPNADAAARFRGVTEGDHQ